MSSSIKMESYLSDGKLADMFRQLADVFEKGAAESGLDALKGMEDFSKIGISVKREYGRLLFKMKVKCKGEEDSESATEGFDGTLKYKTLKKRMKSSFKLIFATLGENTLPPAEAVQAFLRDSELMVRYSGYGDAHYQEYSTAVRAFSEAFGQGNLDAARASCNELDRLKSRCHTQFK
ncbi:MAG: GAK system XXXCH domain-containing protein [Desulfovibrio sp.]